MLLLHGLDHLLGMAAVMVTPGVIYSTLSLVRPALEAAARANYILEPGIACRERFRRGMNFELQSAVERVRLAHGTGKMTPDQMLNVRTRLVHFGMAAPKHGFDLKVSRPRHLPEGMPADRWLDSPTPRAQALLSALLDECNRHQTAGSLHRMSSAVIHVQMHGLLLFVDTSRTEPAEQAGMVMAPVGVSLSDLALWASSVVVGLDRVMSLACKHYGWDEAPWRRAATPAFIELRDALVK